MRASLLALFTTCFLFTLNGQVINSFPHSEDLETWPLCGDICTAPACILPVGWANTGGVDFYTDEGGTTTGFTGPSLDHNPGNLTGNYVYVQSACTGNSGDTGIIETPLVDLTNVINPTFSFWYHQFGIAFTDSMIIEQSLDSGNTWNYLAHGDSSSNVSLDQWSFQFVDLNAFAGSVIKLRIVYPITSIFNEFALDDFYFDGIQAIDAGVDSVYSSTGYCFGDTGEICVTITNFGLLPIDSVTLNTSINGVPFNSPLPVTGIIPPGGDTTVCLGQVLLATGDVLQAYTSLPNGLNDTVNTNDTALFNVTIFALPTVDAGPDTTVCGLDSVTLGGNPTGPIGSTFAWSPGTFLNVNNTGSPIAYYTAIGTYGYQVQVVDSNGCPGEDSVYVTVSPISSVDAGPDTTVCLNDSVVIGGAPSIPAGFSALWSPSQFLNDDTLHNPQAYIPASTSFILQGQDTIGCFFYDTVTVFTYATPALNPGLSASLCVGDSVTLGGSPTATNFATINWGPAATLSNTTVANPVATPIDTTIYGVSIVDTFGCAYTDSVVISTVNAPVANAGVDTTVCAFDTFTIGGSPTGTSGMTFNWSPGLLFNDSTLANPSLVVTQDTVVIVEVIDLNAGCSTFDTLNISIHAIPQVDAGLDTVICLNDSVQVGGTPSGPVGASFSWTPANVFDFDSAANPLFGGLDSMWIFLEVTDGVQGCSNTDSAFVTVNPLPSADAGPDQSICAGDTTGLGSGPTSPTAVSYLWTPAAGLDNPVLGNPLASPVATTVYTVVATDINGCQGVDSTVLTVDTIPIPVVNNPSAICFGDSVQLIASGGDSYFWSPVNDLSNANIANPFASPGTTITYSVNMIDANGCSDSASVQVVVNQLPIVSAGPDQPLCNGNAATLMASGATSYQWQPTIFLTNPNSATTQSSPPSTQGYEVTGTDANGCQETDSVYVIVNLNPSVDAGPSQALCLNDSIQLGGSPTGPAGSTYTWTPAINYVSNSVEDPIFIATTVGTQFYYVNIVDVNGCTGIDSVEIETYALPTAVTQTVNTTLCVGDNVQLQASGGTSFEWPNNNISSTTASNPVVSPTVTSIYTVTVTDGNGCTDQSPVSVAVFPVTPADAGANTGLCVNQTIQLAASGGVSYQWSPALGLSSTFSQTPDCSTLFPTTYTVTVTDVNGCSETDQVFVDVFPLPVVSAGANKSLCKGDALALGGSPTSDVANTFLWAPAATLNSSSVSNPSASPVVNTTYGVTVTTPNGCVDSSTIAISVDSLPRLQIERDPRAICYGDSTLIRIDDNVVSYNWTPTEGIVTSTTVRNPRFSPEETTLYTVVGTDTNGCSSSLDFTVVVYQLPMTSMDVFPLEVCEDDSVFLEAAGGVLYSWLDTGAVNSLDAQNPIGYPSPLDRQFNVIVTDTNGCSAEDSITVVVFQTPSVFAGPDVENCDINLIILGGEPTGASDLTFQWSPESGLNDPFLANPTVLNADNTTFYVEAQDANGCRAVDSVFVRADCFARIYAPTAFTPGGNDINDRFKISYYRVTDTELKIFDRSGALIYQSKDLDEGWDGSYNSGTGAAPSGSYYWQLTYRTDASQKRETDGVVTLVR